MNVEYTKEGKIAYFTLNRPEALNTLSPDLMHELHAALEDFRADDKLWVGIIRALEKRHFVLELTSKPGFPS